MRKLLNKIKTSIWLYPALYSIGALLLSLSIKALETYFSEELSYYLSDLLYTSSELAQTVLGIVSGAFITIATFTFSTTMVVLTMYSSQFTPRVVENFLNNKVTMKSFGVFLSGFIYSITSLLFTSRTSQDSLVIAASVGVVYVIVGLVYFLMFIHNVATHIQASDLILRLQNEAIKKINDYSEYVKSADIISYSGMLELIKNKKCLEVYGHSDGYIQEIDYDNLQRIAKKHDFIITFNKVVGQFITTESKILSIYFEHDDEPEDDVKSAIDRCVLIGNKKTQNQDFSFTIQKIVEIALKALSPGINDPNTAIHCLKIIGVLLRDLAHIEKGYIVLKAEDDYGYVIYEAYDFELLLHDAYDQISFYGRSDTKVTQAILKSLSFIKPKASESNLEIIENYEVKRRT